MVEPFGMLTALVEEPELALLEQPVNAMALIAATAAIASSFFFIDLFPSLGNAGAMPFRIPDALQRERESVLQNL
jgi:hypothetical protein